MSFSELAEIDLPGESEITFTGMSKSEIQTELLPTAQEIIFSSQCEFELN